MIDGISPGERWVTKNGHRTIVIEGEGNSPSGEPTFIVRTVENRRTQYGKLGGSRRIGLSTLLYKYRKA